MHRKPRSSAIVVAIFALFAALPLHSAHAKSDTAEACELAADFTMQLPQVYAAYPRQGTTHGGVPVLVEGEGFKNGARVYIGADDCQSPQIINDKFLTCFTPPLSSGLYELTVENPDGSRGSMHKYSVHPHVFLRSAQVAEGGKAKLTVEHGRTPYRFDILSGNGTLDPRTGEFDATNAVGTTLVRVIDADENSAEAVVEVQPVLTLKIQQPTFKVNQGNTITPTGGVPPFRFEVDPSRGPNGEVLAEVDNTTGAVVTKVPGKYKITVTDAAGNHASFEVKVIPQLKLAVSQKDVVSGEKAQFTATGGEPPYQFTVLGGAGEIDPSSGQFTATDIPGRNVIALKDAEGTTLQAEIAVHARLKVLPDSRTLKFNEPLQLFATGGMPPYEFKVIEGKGWVNRETGAFLAPQEEGMTQIQVTDSGKRTVIASLTTLPAGHHRDSPLLAVGAQHTCVIAGKGVRCWGANDKGQLGSDTQRRLSARPVTVKGLRGIARAITAGFYHTCALTGGTVRCWGDNTYGQLGNNCGGSSLTPLVVQGLEAGVSAVAAGQFHTCALKEGKVFCWGRNEFGQLGTSETQQSAAPLAVSDLPPEITQITAGLKHSCAMTTNSVYCWGDNSSGQLGLGNVRTSAVPKKVGGLSEGVSQIEAGAYHTCAILNEKVVCWGYNGLGLTDEKWSENRLVYKEVENLPTPVSTLAVGFYHSCAIVQGKAQCWGYNRAGQVDPKNPKIRAQPIEREGLINVKQMAGGLNHTCALLENGSVRCWGNNSDAQIGNTAKNDTMIPAERLRVQ